MTKSLVEGLFRAKNIFREAGAGSGHFAPRKGEGPFWIWNMFREVGFRKQTPQPGRSQTSPPISVAGKRGGRGQRSRGHITRFSFPAISVTSKAGQDGGGRRHTIQIPIPDISYHKRKGTRTAGSAGISSGSRFWFFPSQAREDTNGGGRRHTIQIPIPDISCHKRGRARAAGARAYHPILVSDISYQERGRARVAGSITCRSGKASVAKTAGRERLEGATIRIASIEAQHGWGGPPHANRRESGSPSPRTATADPSSSTTPGEPPRLAAGGAQIEQNPHRERRER